MNIILLIEFYFSFVTKVWLERYLLVNNIFFTLKVLICDLFFSSKCLRHLFVLLNYQNKCKWTTWRNSAITSKTYSVKKIKKKWIGYPKSNWKFKTQTCCFLCNKTFKFSKKVFFFFLIFFGSYLISQCLCYLDLWIFYWTLLSYMHIYSRVIILKYFFVCFA